MKQFYTYIHCRPDGTPFYVGKGHGTRSHEFRRRNRHHKNVVAKHGEENIGVFIFPCESEAAALKDEIRQIAQLRRDGYDLANITSGGDGVSGLKHSDETKAKLSAATSRNRIGVRISPETREKIREAQIGKSRGPNPEHSARLKGRTLPPEHRAAIGAAHKGLKRSAEARAAMSDAQKGHHVSDEAKTNMSVAHIGKKLPVGTRNNMRIAQLKRWALRKEMQIADNH